jgi:hypothetical protein
VTTVALWEKINVAEDEVKETIETLASYLSAELDKRDKRIDALEDELDAAQDIIASRDREIALLAKTFPKERRADD